MFILEVDKAVLCYYENDGALCFFQHQVDERLSVLSCTDLD